MELIIPSIHLDQCVNRYGLTDGELVPPPGTVISYTGNPLPGDVGVAVVAGHDQYNGRDVFWFLYKVRKGADIYVRRSGHTQHWVATSNAVKVPKTDAMNDRSIWRSLTRQPELVLFTCSADFIVNGHSLYNYEVRAKLVGVS